MIRRFLNFLLSKLFPVKVYKPGEDILALHVSKASKTK